MLFCRGKIDIPIRLGIELFELIMGAHIRWKFKRVLKDLYFRYVDPGPVDSVMFSLWLQLGLRG